MRPVRLLLNGRPPVYTPALKVKLTVQQGAGSVNGTLLPPEEVTRMEAATAIRMKTGVINIDEEDSSDAEDGLAKAVHRQEEGNLEEYEDDDQPLPFERHWDSEGEEELDEVEADILFQAMKLATERDEETEDENEDSDEDSDIDAENGQKSSDDDSDYISNEIRGIRRHSTLSKSAKKAGRNPKFKHRAKDNCGAGKQKHKPKTKLSYEFCPLPHRLSILRLLAKHFCQHPLLPERHGQSRSSEQIHRDSVHEMYLHCKNNHLREVWAYLWTNWYSPEKWRLWARSAYPYAIPRKRTTMLVEAMWRNFKRMVLHLYNRPRVDFATYALVTQALPAYRHKLVRILHNPRKGRAATLNGEQIPIKKAWLLLRNKDIKGQYDTNVLCWTCSCGAQKYHSYLLCKHLVKALPFPDPNWWATIVRRHIPPFYDIRALLSSEDRARAPAPEELGDRSWLARMPGTQGETNTPTVSHLPVCIACFSWVRTDL